MFKNILIFLSLFLFSVNVTGQVKTFFGGTINIYSSSGTSPEYTLQGFFNDTSGEYASDSVALGDIIYVSEGSTCVRLRIDTINSSVGGIIDVDVFDVDTISVSPPSGISIIMRETPGYDLTRYVAGVSETLLSCVLTHSTGIIDENLGGGGGNTTFMDSLPVASIIIDANGNLLKIDSTSTIQFNAVGTAQGDLIVSGNSSLPSSLSHISGGDTSQINIQGGNITLATTGDIDFGDDLNLHKIGTSTILERTTDGSGQFKIYASHSGVIDPIGITMAHTPTLRSISIGDVDSEFNQYRLTINDSGSSASLGGYGFGYNVLGTVATIGDYLNEDNGTQMIIDDNNSRIRFGDLEYNETGFEFDMDITAPYIKFGDLQVDDLGVMYNQTGTKIEFGDIEGEANGSMFLLDFDTGIMGFGDMNHIETGFRAEMNPSSGQFDIGDLSDDGDGTGMSITDDEIYIGEIYSGDADRFGIIHLDEDEMNFYSWDLPDSTHFQIKDVGVTQYSEFNNDIATSTLLNDIYRVTMDNLTRHGEMNLDTSNFYINFTDPTDTSSLNVGISGISLTTRNSILFADPDSIRMSNTSLINLRSAEGYWTWGEPQSLVSNPVDTMNNGLWLARSQSLLGYSGGSNWSFLAANQSEAKMVYKSIDNGNSNAIIKVGSNEAAMRINNETSGGLLTQFAMSNTGMSMNFNAFSVYSASNADSLLYLYEDLYALPNDQPSSTSNEQSLMVWEGNGSSTDSDMRRIGEVILGTFLTEVSTNTTLSQLNAFLPVDVSSGAVEIDLPAGTPSAGDIFTVADSRGNAGTFNITIDFTSAGDNLHGNSQNYVMNANNDVKTFVYINTTIGWIIKN